MTTSSGLLRNLQSVTNLLVEPVAPKSLSRKALHRLVWSKPMSQAAESLGLSPNGLAKICDRLLIPYPTRGHWTKAPGDREPRPGLPRAPDFAAGPVVISSERARSRRSRTRLAPEARRQQLLDTATAIVAAEGIHAATMKRIAREIGVSEALAFTYFKSRAALLAEVARRELAEMEAIRHAEIKKGETSRFRVALSTRAYLQQIEQRGSVLHVLLAAPEVRALLRPERRSTQAQRGASVAATLTSRYGVDPDLAHGATQALTAASRRAGRLLAMKRVSREAAERLTLSMIERANRDLVSNSERPLDL